MGRASRLKARRLNAPFTYTPDLGPAVARAGGVITFADEQGNRYRLTQAEQELAWRIEDSDRDLFMPLILQCLAQGDQRSPVLSRNFLEGETQLMQVMGQPIPPGTHGVVINLDTSAGELVRRPASPAWFAANPHISFNRGLAL